MMQMWWVSRNLPYPPHNQLVFMPSFGIYTEFEEEPKFKYHHLFLKISYKRN